MRKAVSLISLLALAAPLAAATLAGVTLPDDAQAGDHRLVLNGLGLRKKAIIKVYVAGLYLPAKQTGAAAVLAADAPRRMVMHILYGLSAERLCEGWKEGLANNTPTAPAEVKAAFDTLCGWMDETEKGDQLVFTYLPGEGTRVEVKGQAKGTIEGKAFADALFACWLGPKPPSEDFKAGLLGG